MTPAERRARHHAFVLAAARGDEGAALALASPRVELLQSLRPGLPPGAAGLRAAIRLLRATFEPLEIDVTGEIADGARAIASVRIFARHVGPIGPLLATGRRTLLDALVWSELDERGLVARAVVEADGASVLGDLSAFDVDRMTLGGAGA